jgi:hypothetical protein
MTRSRWCHQHGQWDELDGRVRLLLLGGLFSLLDLHATVLVHVHVYV